MRNILRSGLLATTLAVATILPVVSASAQTTPDNGFIGTNPPGTGGDGRQGEINVRGNVICINGDAWLVNPNRRTQIPRFPGLRGELWLTRPNNMCPITGVVTEYQQPRTVFGGSASALRQVSAGWEVWRFYGTRTGDTQTVQGYTVSFAATRNWGDTNDVVTVTPHPDDRGTPISGSPWRVRQYTNLAGETVTLAEANQISTNPPFRSLGANCARLRTPEAARRALASDPSTFRAGLFSDYSDLLSSGAGRWSWITARTGINAANGQPITSPGQIVYDDGIDCTSPYEYASLTGGGVTLDGVFQGVCVIPITRLQQQLTDGSWATLNRYGARYSSEYGLQPPGDYDEWRTAIAQEVGSRRSSTHLRYHTAPTPGQPSDVRTGQSNLLEPYNQAQAALAAARHAECREGFPGLGAASGSVNVTEPRVIINVDIPEVFQIGGQLRTGQTIWAGHSELLCDGAACPERTAQQPVSLRTRTLTPDHLTSVRYQLDVDVDGMRACRTSNPAEQCDYTIDGPDDRGGWTAYPPQPSGEPRAASAQQTAAAHRERRQRIEMTFYSATNPGEDVTVSIRNVSATYATYAWGRTQIGVTACVQNVDGASLGSRRAAPSQGDQDRRWDGKDYFVSTPGGSVTQWETYWAYDDVVEHRVQWPDGTYAGRAAPWTEYVNGRYETRPVSVPLWECNEGVYDDVEISSTATIPANQIEVRGLGSRQVIGANVRR